MRQSPDRRDRTDAVAAAPSANKAAVPRSRGLTNGEYTSLPTMTAKPDPARAPVARDPKPQRASRNTRR